MGYSSWGSKESDTTEHGWRSASASQDQRLQQAVLVALPTQLLTEAANFSLRIRWQTYEALRVRQPLT